VSAWHTLKEIDAAAGRRKGAAFRAFKRCENGWREGVDFRVLRPERDGPELEMLRMSGRLYTSSRVGILLSPAAAEALRAAMAGAFVATRGARE
jgi:hypothetical protein